MPDYYDVCELQVRANDPPVPIVWTTISDLTWEDSERRQIRSRSYVNQPRQETTFRLADGYTIPDNWTLGTGGRLYYRPILGQTIPVRITAQRAGVPNVDSNEFSITRRQAFVSQLIPDRINIGLEFNNATQRVYVFNTTTAEVANDVGHVQDFITVFNTDGDEQVSESLEVSLNVPERASCIGFDGTHVWLAGKDSGFYTGTGGLWKYTTAGTRTAQYSYTNGRLEGLAYDGTYMWGLDISNATLRAFNLSGVEQTTRSVQLPRTGDDRFHFSDAQYGFAYGDGHFWIVQSSPSWKIRCVTTAGVPVTSRDITIEHGCAGVAYNPTTRNLWYILDRDNPRRGILRTQRI